MSTCPSPHPWSVADVTFVRIRIEQPHERQMRVGFDRGVTLVITDAEQIPLASLLIETLRNGAGKEAIR